MSTFEFDWTFFMLRWYENVEIVKIEEFLEFLLSKLISSSTSIDAPNVQYNMTLFAN